MDARLQGRVDASDVLQDAFLDAATQLDNFLRGSELPAFLWLRLVVSQRLSIYHRRHLGTKMRDAGQEVSLYRDPLPQASSAALASMLLGPTHVPFARSRPGRASTPGPGGTQRARPPGPRGRRAATLRGAQSRRDGAGAGDHRGSRGEAVHAGPQAIQGDPGSATRRAWRTFDPWRSTTSERDDLLDRLGEEFAARFRRGEQPSLKDYADRYPELADEIRELFPAMVKVEQVKEICQDWDEAERADARAASSQVGDYRIIREIGRGGMGVVYEAEQVSLGRRVALKVLPWQSAADGTTLERFRREARASARLHHTNIVPVFEVGQDGRVQLLRDAVHPGPEPGRGDRRAAAAAGPIAVRGQPGRPGRPTARPGRPDSATRARDARSWPAGAIAADAASSTRARPVMADGARSRSPRRQRLARPAEPAGTTAPDTSAVMPGGAQLSSVESRHRAFHRGVAHIGRQAASALAHAHARGIVHRDIKPSNLLLDTEGVVWVSDFGLAKVDDDDLTRTGDILGTLRYMAPERFRGRRRRPGRPLLAGLDPLRAAGAAAGLRLARPGGALRADQVRRPAPAALDRPARPARPGDDRPQGDREGPEAPLRLGRGDGRGPAAVPRR